MDRRGPPSYQDATKRPDWLELAAEYIPLREYARLCLVARRFYHQFGPRLWNDPLTAAGILNRDNGECRLRTFLASALLACLLSSNSATAQTSSGSIASWTICAVFDQPLVRSSPRWT